MLGDYLALWNWKLVEQQHLLASMTGAQTDTTFLVSTLKSPKTSILRQTILYFIGW